MKGAAVLLILALAGCHRAPPLPATPTPIFASVLVNPPYPGSKQVGAMPVFPGMYPTGSSGCDNDKFAGTFKGHHDYVLQRGKGGDVDPDVIDTALRRWIESAPGVTVTGTSEPPGASGSRRRMFDYYTVDTVGYAVYEIEPATPAPKVRYELKVFEHRRR